MLCDVPASSRRTGATLVFLRAPVRNRSSFRSGLFHRSSEHISIWSGGSSELQLGKTDWVTTKRELEKGKKILNFFEDPVTCLFIYRFLFVLPDCSAVMWLIFLKRPTEPSVYSLLQKYSVLLMVLWTLPSVWKGTTQGIPCSRSTG